MRELDLAVLKIDDEEIAKSLPAAETIETSEIKVGNIVLAVGRTGGEAGASFGIVGQTGAAWRSWRGDEIERFISLDLAINLGSSGGALIDADGKILGVNTSAFGRRLALTILSEQSARRQIISFVRRRKCLKCCSIYWKRKVF